MLDWQVPDDESLPPLPDTEAARRRSFRYGRHLTGLLLLGLLVGAALLRWRITERQQALQADLEVAIRQEEQQRAFDLTEAAD